MGVRVRAFVLVFHPLRDALTMSKLCASVTDAPPHTLTLPHQAQDSFRRGVLLQGLRLRAFEQQHDRGLRKERLFQRPAVLVDVPDLRSREGTHPGRGFPSVGGIRGKVSLFKLACFLHHRRRHGSLADQLRRFVFGVSCRCA